MSSVPTIDQRGSMQLAPSSHPVPRTGWRWPPCVRADLCCKSSSCRGSAPRGRCQLSPSSLVPQWLLPSSAAEPQEGNAKWVCFTSQGSGGSDGERGVCRAAGRGRAGSCWGTWARDACLRQDYPRWLRGWSPPGLMEPLLWQKEAALSFVQALMALDDARATRKLHPPDRHVLPVGLTAGLARTWRLRRDAVSPLQAPTCNLPAPPPIPVGSAADTAPRLLQPLPGAWARRLGLVGEGVARLTTFSLRSSCIIYEELPL